MLGHYLKIAARNLIRHKGHSLINILGLALGMTCCLLILLFVRHELSYDRFHPDADRIYRITEEVEYSGEPRQHWAITPPPMGPALQEDVKEISEVVRLVPYFEGGIPGRSAVDYRNEKHFFEWLFWGDPNVFRVFDLPLTAGDPKTALVEPNTLVISESAAKRYFGDEPAIGKVLRIDSNLSDEEYRITGVFRDVPANSHIHFDLLASMATFYRIQDQRVILDQWYLSEFYTYVKLAEGASASEVEQKLAAFVKKRFPPMKFEVPKVWLHLQPVADIHLRSHIDQEIEVNGDVKSIYILAAVAVLALLIACVNFMNLSTARFAGRAREVGVRKVVGAHRSQLISQFLGEATVLCALAMVLAVVLVQVTLPAFNALTGKHLALRFDTITALGLLGLTVLVGLVAGSYPAFFLSAFRPVQVLKSSLVGGVGSGAFRKILITFQFFVSVALLIGVGIIWDQLRYMRAQKLGFDMENVVAVPMRDVKLRDNFYRIKEEVARVPNVRAATFSSLILGRDTPSVFMKLPDTKIEDNLGSLIVDWDYQDVFKIPLVAGRMLVPGEENDKAAGFLVNEAAVRRWGFSSPQEVIGKRAFWGGWKKGKIVGVVRDFHNLPLQFEVEPLILHVRPIAFHYLYVRIAPENRGATLRDLEAAWSRIQPGKPFEYFFLDDEFSHYYRAEERLGKLVGFFALVAVFVACLGLLGLASFTAERRTREIGIRKVLGSSVGEVVLLLSKELTLLVLLANLIAWPVAYLLAREWLQGFAYRTDIHLLNFVAGGVAALIVAWLAVSYQTLKAALVDPAEALRYE